MIEVDGFPQIAFMGFFDRGVRLLEPLDSFRQRVTHEVAAGFAVGVRLPGPEDLHAEALVAMLFAWTVI